MVINQPQFTPQKKNKVNPVLLMGAFAVVLGLVSAIGIGQYLNKQTAKVNELTVMKAAVVASKDIPPGVKLKSEDLTTKEFPSQTIPMDCPATPNLIVGREVKNQILKDEVVTEAKLLPIIVASGLPTLIPVGMRGVTVRVNDIIGVGGFVKPGDYVDIIAIYKNKNETISKAIFENIQVLAAGEKALDPKAVPDVAPKIVSLLTVAVTPQDAEKLFLVSTSGQFQFSLRAFGDKSIIASEGIYPEDVYGYVGGSSPNRKKGGVLDGVFTPRKNIELILGNVREYKILDN